MQIRFDIDVGVRVGKKQFHDVGVPLLCRFAQGRDAPFVPPINQRWALLQIRSYQLNIAIPCRPEEKLSLGSGLLLENPLHYLWEKLVYVGI